MNLIGPRINGSLVLTMLAVVGIAIVSLLVEQPASRVGAQEISGAQVYASKCASCHQPTGIGVRGTFPPLLGNDAATDPDYVTDVIVNGRSGELEVDGVSYSTPMPAVAGISDEETDAVVAYVVDLAGRSSEPATSTPATTEAPEPPSASTGKALFTGSDRFDNGAAACSSCHTAGSVGNLSGPGLGPDLTSTHETLGGDVGLRAWLSNPPSETMTPLFADKPLSDTELDHLVAFLADTPSHERQSGPDRLVLAGIAGLAVLLSGMAAAYRGMRQTYVSRLRSNR